MTLLSEPIDVIANARTNDFQPVKPGKYPVKITGAQEKKSRNEDTMLEVEFELDGGRRLWNIFNLWHPKEDVRRIAKEEFSALANAIGVTGQIRDTEQILNKKIEIQVAIRKDDATKNAVKGFFPLATTGNLPSPSPTDSSAPTPSSPWD
tara:strand:+ start:897 stop:1346 length:450 start_codon:yes stop_codon:yes gene_type:complete